MLAPAASVTDSTERSRFVFWSVSGMDRTMPWFWSEVGNSATSVSTVRRVETLAGRAAERVVGGERVEREMAGVGTDGVVGERCRDGGGGHASEKTDYDAGRGERSEKERADAVAGHCLRVARIIRIPVQNRTPGYAGPR